MRGDRTLHGKLEDQKVNLDRCILQGSKLPILLFFRQVRFAYITPFLPILPSQNLPLLDHSSRNNPRTTPHVDYLFYHSLPTCPVSHDPDDSLPFASFPYSSHLPMILFLAFSPPLSVVPLLPPLDHQT
jgi:hypothetical protein